MDERDIRLLKAIADLGTGSPEALHEETDIPVSTIHYRLNNLREDGVIENDLYDLDHEALGLGVTVIVEVLASYEGPYEEFADELLAVEGVTEAFFTMGETDFVVLARLSSSDTVERLISDFEAIPEVGDGGVIQAIDPGAPSLSGSFNVRFANFDNYDAALNNGTASLELMWELAANRYVKFTIHRLRLPKVKHSITGPGGIEASYDWRGELDTGQGASLTVELANAQADYSNP